MCFDCISFQPTVHSDDGDPKCDFCFLEFNTAKNKFNQGCGVKNSTKDLFVDDYNSCNLVRKAKSGKVGTDPPLFSDTEIIRCACQKDDCNANPMKYFMPMKIKQ